MKRKPRDPEQPILTRPLLAWLAVAGFVMGACTLGVIWWGADHRTEAIARTMGLTTFAIANLFFSITCRDELQSVFSLDFLEDRKLVIASGLSVAAIVLGTELRVLQKILHTESLTLREWLACIGLGFVIVAVSEAKKALARRRGPEAGEADEAEEEVAGAPVGAAAA